MDEPLRFQIVRSKAIKKQGDKEDTECRTFYYGRSGYVCLRKPGERFIVELPEKCPYYKSGCTYFKKGGAK